MLRGERKTVGNGSRIGPVFITLLRLTLFQKLMNNIPVCQLVSKCVCDEAEEVMG